MDDNTSSAPRQLFSQQVEEAFLGAALIDPGRLNLIDLATEDLYIQRNRWVYQAIRSLLARGVEPDFSTIADELDRLGHLEQVGGIAYLAGLISSTPSSLGMADYAESIKDYARRRSIIQSANELAKVAYAPAAIDEPVASVVDKLVTSVRPNRGANHWDGALDGLIDSVTERMENPNAMWGIPTGFRDYDKTTGGLQPGEILYIGGEPGVGKSILSMQMGLNMARAGHPGVIYSLEMGALQIMRRAVSALAHVETRKLKTGALLPEEWDKIAATVNDCAAWPLYICDHADLTTAALRADLSRLRLLYGIEWFVLDYLFLMGDGDGKMDDNQRTALLSRRIKTITSSLGLAGITVNSVTKSAMGTSAEPTQKDIRGSGQVVHDADTIIFITKHIPDTMSGKKEEVNDNLRTVTFGKGRELESSAPFHLVKLPSYPAFGDYAGRDAMSGRVTTPTQSRGAINPAAQR
jgi:replicative DNA helicase